MVLLRLFIPMALSGAKLHLDMQQVCGLVSAI